MNLAQFCGTCDCWLRPIVFFAGDSQVDTLRDQIQLSATKQRMHANLCAQYANNRIPWRTDFLLIETIEHARACSIIKLFPAYLIRMHNSYCTDDAASDCAWLVLWCLWIQLVYIALAATLIVLYPFFLSAATALDRMALYAPNHDQPNVPCTARLVSAASGGHSLNLEAGTSTNRASQHLEQPRITRYIPYTGIVMQACILHSIAIY